MEKSKDIISVRLDTEDANRLREIAQAYTRPGEEVNLSVVIREAVRLFLAIKEAA